jgi:hypothetical protein
VANRAEMAEGGTSSNAEVELALTDNPVRDSAASTSRDPVAEVPQLSAAESVSPAQELRIDVYDDAAELEGVPQEAPGTQSPSILKPGIGPVVGIGSSRLSFDSSGPDIREYQYVACLYRPSASTFPPLVCVRLFLSAFDCVRPSPMRRRDPPRRNVDLGTGYRHDCDDDAMEWNEHDEQEMTHSRGMYAVLAAMFAAFFIAFQLATGGS